jgi:hypothetical protein
MGRGWSTAQREGTDVTERVLGEARQALADGSAHGAPGGASSDAAGVAPPEAQPGDDYPSRAGSPAPEPAPQPAAAAEIAGLLGPEPERLLAAWRGVTARTGGLAPSESLALAERELHRKLPPGG